MNKIRPIFFRNHSNIMPGYNNMNYLLEHSTYSQYPEFIQEKDNNKEKISKFFRAFQKLKSLEDLILPDSLLTFEYNNELRSIQLVNTVVAHILLSDRTTWAFNKIDLMDILKNITNEELSKVILIDFANAAMPANIFNDNVKVYAETHNLNYINKLKQLKEKSYTELIHRFHNEDIVLQLFSGFAYDMKNDIFIINSTLSNGTSSTLDLKDLFFLLKPNVWGTQEELLNKVETTQNYLTDILNDLETFNMFTLELEIFRNTKQTVQNKLNNVKSDIHSYLSSLNNLIQQKEDLTDKLFALNNKTMTFEITPILAQFKKEGFIHKAFFRDDRLQIIWNPLPIIFFDEKRLEKASENILSRSRKQYVKKLIDGELFLYTMPFRSSINASTMELFTYAISLNNTPFRAYTTNSYYNRHPLYNAGHGCLGSFSTPFTQAKQEHNWKMFLHLLKQFYQSITIGDPLGDEACNNLFICDENGTVVLEDHPLNGLNIIKECMEGL